jgi:hypothetical protein
MIITKCKMPDLSDLKKAKIVSHFLVCQLIGTGTNFPEKLESYRINLARLIDKAINEYLEARDYVLAEIDEPKRSIEDMTKNGRYVYVHFIANELENCLMSTRRIFRYFERIKSDKNAPYMDKVLKRQLESLESDIREIRDLIEHLDKDIHEGKKKLNESVMPVLNSDATEIKLLSNSLKTEALALVIRKFHGFAYEFMEYKINNEGEYSKI